MKPSSKKDTHTFRVGATAKGRRIEFTVKATTGAKAEAQARKEAKEQGIPRIMVNYIRLKTDTSFVHSPDYADAPTEIGGTYYPADSQLTQAGRTQPPQIPILSIEETQKFINIMWERLLVFIPKPDKAPLIAYKQADRLFLDDGVSGRAEITNISTTELVMMFYEWATYTGWCSENFEDFLEMCWN